jgi:uncharacterized repeat protein (TIGR01451 family)
MKRRAVRWLPPAVVGALAALAVAVATAPAATTPISSFSMTGRDAQTGSTATAGGPAGATAAGDTIDWVLSYLNRTSGVANVSITDPIAGNQTFVPGSLQLPRGSRGGGRPTAARATSTPSRARG